MTLLSRVSAVYEREGLSGVLQRVYRELRRHTVWPIFDAIDSMIARGQRDQFLHHNDFFFEELSVTRAAVLARHQEIVKKTGLPVEEMESLHETFFAALEVSGFRPKNILEIGTDRGNATVFLSALFPEASIISVELPADDPIYHIWHWEGREKHEAMLSEKLDRPNITLMRTNTMKLMEKNLPDFDLIWLDGGHEFPEVAWDHFFSMQKLKKGGWVFSDDIYFPGAWDIRKRPEYIHPFQVIDYYNKRMTNGFRFLIKREDDTQSIKNTKYIAFWQNV